MKFTIKYGKHLYNIICIFCALRYEYKMVPIAKLGIELSAQFTQHI